jgi:magnesium transporter
MVLSVAEKATSDPHPGSAAASESNGRPALLPRAGHSVCQVSHDRGSAEMHFSRETVADLLAGEGFFWLDLDRPQAGDFEILREVFGFHPLAVEDSEQFDQRAKIDDYDDFVFLVVYGASPDDDRLVEVHCFYSERFLVTVHHDDCPAFAEIRRRYQKRDEAIDRPSLLLYRIVDGLVDSFFPILADFDNRIDELENQIFNDASDKQLQEIFQMKRLLVGMRKAVTPQRDSFAGLRGGIAQLPGLAEEDEHYFRDVYDHLIRISDLIDSYRDLLTSAMDVPLDRLEPAQRCDEAAGRDRNDLSAAQLADRLLRPKLRLAHQPHRTLASVRRRRRRHRVGRARRPPRILQAARLVLAGRRVLVRFVNRRRGEIAAMVGGRVDLARKPPRLRTLLFDLRNLA